MKDNQRGNAPTICSTHLRQMAGALPLNGNPSLNPARWAGPGKRPGLRPWTRGLPFL